MFCSIENSNSLEKNMGFTLVELVMVLVLLGILAAVALPKYFDMQEAAQQRAALLAVAEAQARIESRFAELVVGGESCAKAVETVADLTALADVTDAGKAVFGDYALTPSKLDVTNVTTAMSVAVVDGTTETAISFEKGNEPQLALPQCSESETESPVVANSVAEAIWKIIDRNSELLEACQKNNNQCTSRNGSGSATQKIIDELIRAGFEDISDKVWAAEMDGTNLRIVVTSVSQEQANQMRAEGKTTVEATVYSSLKQEMSVIKDFKLREEKGSGKAYVDTGDLKAPYSDSK